jgi:hypothetical protein
MFRRQEPRHSGVQIQAVRYQSQRVLVQLGVSPSIIRRTKAFPYKST